MGQKEWFLRECFGELGILEVCEPSENKECETGAPSENRQEDWVLREGFKELAILEVGEP